MRYVIGVDGGQTSTTAVVADETGCLLGIGQGGPANHIHEPGGVERVRRSLTDAIQDAIVCADLQNARIAAVCLGMTGGSPQMEAICLPVIPSDRVIFGHDTRIALYSVTFGRPGAVVIAGTGAACYGINAAGEDTMTGGWGYLLGDEGSGYWIAVRALNACCRAQDGLIPPTQLLPLLLRHLEAPDLKHIHGLVYSGNIGRPGVAALAEIVTLAAAQGDVMAKRILHEAGKELALGICSVLTRLGLEQQSITVGTVGGVFHAGRAVLHTFRAQVMKVAPQASITPARVPAVVAAALMALEEIEVPIRTDLLANVEISLPRLGTVKT